MNDLIGPAQGLESLMAQKAVRVGNNADQNRQFSVLTTGY
jgi:hypothetical protein